MTIQDPMPAAARLDALAANMLMAEGRSAAMSVAIIGGGPTALYTLHHLLRSPVPLSITLFEKDRGIGPGMPYREEINAPEMLANIGSREIPPLVTTLEDFLKDCDPQTLREMQVDPDNITPDAFYPRVTLGRYFAAQAAELVALARGLGHRVDGLSRVTVTDIVPDPKTTLIEWQSPEGDQSARFDHVVIATGHRWSPQVMEGGVTLHPPWPADRLKRFAGQRLGILGSSLTAIDAAIALARLHGTFDEDGEDVRWIPDPKAPPFSIVMLSRKGLLPDADWYYPLPLPPLPGFSAEVIGTEIDRGSEGLLDRCQAHLAAALRRVDPDYARVVRPEQIDGLAARHFAERMAADPWEIARSSLAEAARDRANLRTSPWRAALLEAHEVYEKAVPHFDEADRDRFLRELKPVFVDVYASVPHRSIRRMLALHDAGVLSMMALGDDYRLTRDGSATRIAGAGGDGTVDALIDARGQQPVALDDLGFASLAARARVEEGSLALTLPKGFPGTISCLAIPVLITNRPFVQGLTSAEKLAGLAAETILAAVAKA